MTRYSFGEYVVDTGTVEIIGPSGPAEFEPQVFAVLEYLLAERGRLITKEELLDNVWGDRFVSESALTTRIKQARRAIGDDGRTQWAIKTVHGRGYRFLPDTTIVPEAAPHDATDTERADTSTTAAATPDAGSIPMALRPEGRHRCYGREDELEQAANLVDAPGDDPMRWIWILGEPGIGKTRVAAEVARRAHAEGHRILFGRNSEDLVVPFQPFIDVLRTALSDTGADQLLAELGSDATTMARLIPELTPEPDSTAPVGPVVDDETQRYQLFEAIAAWLTTISSSRPTLLVIDDAHWAAASTLQTLAHLQRRQAAAQVTVLVTARDTAPDENPRVADLIAAAQGAEGTRVLRLGGLPADAARRLVGNDADLAAALEQTAGNPLLLQAVNPEDGTVDIGSAVRRRVASLSEGVQTTLSYAATIGLEFDVRIAAAAADRDELDVLDDLERAAAARLLDDVDVDRFRFTHALVRSSLRDDLSSARRARLHGRIADAIAEFAGDDPRSLPELAHHTAEAAAVDRSRGPRAVELLESAAAMSSEQLSFGEAALFLERARRLVDDDDHVTRAGLALRQGIAETRAGFNLAAPVSLETACDEAAAGDDPLTRIEAAIRHEDATWRTGSVASTGGTGRSSLRLIDDASTVLDALEHEPNDPGDDEVLRLRTRLEIGRIRALAMEGRFDDALSRLDATHELARRVDDAELEAALLNIQLSHLRYSTDVEGSDVAVDRLCELMEQFDDTDVLMHALLVIALYRLATGDFPAHRRAMDRMLETNSALHSGFWEEVVLNQQAMMAMFEGDLARCETIAEQVLELSTSMPNEDRSGVYGLRMFMIRREQDALMALAPMIRQVIERGDVGSFWAPGLALLLAESGSTTEAQQLIAGFGEQRFDVPRDGMWETVMVLLINTAVILDDIDACVALREVFTRVGGTNLITGAGQLCFGSADRYLGMLAVTIGDLEEAEGRLGRALEVDAAGESALWSNESRLWLAKVRRAQGHAAEADAMFEVVAEQAAAAGLPRLRRLALAELSDR